jgi:hypothetical protein
MFYLRDGYIIRCYSISVIVMSLKFQAVAFFSLCCVWLYWLLRVVVLFLYRGRMCVLLAGVHFLQYSEWWGMCINVYVLHV